MTPKEKAKELVWKYSRALQIWDLENSLIAIKCALIAVDYIITSNPHSNPFNTDVYSTMSYWQEVKNEIEKL
jgi:spore germination protein GerM